MTHTLRTNRRVQSMLTIVLVGGVMLWTAPGVTQTQPEQINPRDMVMTIPGLITVWSSTLLDGHSVSDLPSP